VSARLAVSKTPPVGRQHAAKATGPPRNPGSTRPSPVTAVPDSDRDRVAPAKWAGDSAASPPRSPSPPRVRIHLSTVVPIGARRVASILATARQGLPRTNSVAPRPDSASLTLDGRGPQPAIPGCSNGGWYHGGDVQFRLVCATLLGRRLDLISTVGSAFLSWLAMMPPQWEQC